MDSLKKKRDLKAERKKTQEENVKKKQEAADAKKPDKKKVNFNENANEEQEEDYGDVNVDEGEVKKATNKPKLLGKRRKNFS